MINIGNQNINMNCPNCNRLINITLKQVANERLIKCSCGEKIQLKDNNGTGKKSMIKIDKSLKDLEKTLKNFGK